MFSSENRPNCAEKSVALPNERPETRVHHYETTTRPVKLSIGIRRAWHWLNGRIIHTMHPSRTFGKIRKVVCGQRLVTPIVTRGTEDCEKQQ
jgi:hypothetical protein